MHVRFVVFRVKDDLDAAVLLEAVRFNPALSHRAVGVEMSPGELRQAVLTEINEKGEWHPPPPKRSTP